MALNEFQHKARTGQPAAREPVIMAPAQALRPLPAEPSVIAAPAAPALAVGADLPVFVTANGRPRRSPTWAGRLAAFLLALWIASVVVGALGFARLPLLSPAVALHAATSALHQTPRHLRSAVVRSIVHVRAAHGDGRTRRT
jgi:hypothetical protein